MDKELSSLLDYILSFREVGKRFSFGSYQGCQILWRVLEVADYSLLVISENILMTKPFDSKRMSKNWKVCTLNKWLNNEFYNEAFTAGEKNFIEDTPQGKIFLLTTKEIEKYFPERLNRLCLPIPYAKSSEVDYSSEDYDPGSDYSLWWLSRTPNKYPCFRTVEAVDNEGRFTDISVDFPYCGIRPVLRLKT